MHLRFVEIFCDVAQRRSFPKGAQAHEVSQSSASQAVNVLEYDAMDCAMIPRSVCGGHATCNTTCVPPPVEGKACGSSTDRTPSAP